jgi:prepilin-type N-terminal cleavage/methylation domain-containing protein
MSRIFSKKRDLHQGFTLVELIVAISIFAILCSIAIPAYSSWLPDYKLKNAVRDLYSNMHHAKMLAIKQNATYKIVFDTTGKGLYSIVRPDETIERAVSLASYNPNGGIRFGLGKATKPAGGSIPLDGVSYGYNKIHFNPRGTSGLGYVYLENEKGVSYALGSWIAGILVIKKWNEVKGEWE